MHRACTNLYQLRLQPKFVAIALATNFLCCVLSSVQPGHAQTKNVNDLPSQLTVPQAEFGQPAAGKRVWQHLPDGKRLPPNETGEPAHTIYLPSNWQANSKYPVIFEYPGNGGFHNGLGDSSAGTVDGCRIGFGLSQGRDAIWVCLPFVDTKTNTHARQWWGDAGATVAYCKATIEIVCDQWGGDREKLLLCGFSRGAIATSYIGLRDPELARQWRGLFAHSHYDGVRTWPYADSDRASARQRIVRFTNKPQWISHEETIQPIRDFFADQELDTTHITFQAIPFPNHSPDWLLKDLPETKAARQWFHKLLSE